MTTTTDRDIGTTASPQQSSLPSAQSLRLITRSELLAIVPYTPQHILRLEKRGLFPRRIQVGPNRVAWLLSEVEEWVAARVIERDTSGQQRERQGR